MSVSVCVCICMRIWVYVYGCVCVCEVRKVGEIIEGELCLCGRKKEIKIESELPPIIVIIIIMTFIIFLDHQNVCFAQIAK